MLHVNCLVNVVLFANMPGNAADFTKVYENNMSRFVSRKTASNLVSSYTESPGIEERKIWIFVYSHLLREPQISKTRDIFSYFFSRPFIQMSRSAHSVLSMFFHALIISSFSWPRG